MKEGAPRARCPSNSVVRGAQLIAREFAGALIGAGQDPSITMPFVRRGLETVEEAAEIVLPERCVNQVLKCVLPIQDFVLPEQKDLLRK